MLNYTAPKVYINKRPRLLTHAPQPTVTWTVKGHARGRNRRYGGFVSGERSWSLRYKCERF